MPRAWTVEECAYLIAKHRAESEETGSKPNIHAWYWPNQFPERTYNTVKKYASQLVTVADVDREFITPKANAQAHINSRGSNDRVIQDAESGGLQEETIVEVGERLKAVREAKKNGLPAPTPPPKKTVAKTPTQASSPASSSILSSPPPDLDSLRSGEVTDDSAASPPAQDLQNSRRGKKRALEAPQEPTTTSKVAKRASPPIVIRIKINSWARTVGFEAKRALAKIFLGEEPEYDEHQAAQMVAMLRRLKQKTTSLAVRNKLDSAYAAILHRTIMYDWKLSRFAVDIYLQPITAVSAEVLAVYTDADDLEMMGLLK